MTSLEQTISTLVLSSRRSRSESFKRDIEKRLDYYNDRQLPYLLELISAQFAHADPLSVQPHFFNIVKPIINETSMVYRSGARRMLTTEDGSDINPQIYALWQYIQTNASYDAILKTINRMVNLCRTILAKVSFRDDKLRLDVFTPNLVDVISDNEDPTRAKAITYVRPSQSSSPRPQAITHYWDSERYLRISPNGEIIENPGNPEGINPYRILPFVRFTNQVPIGDYFVRGGDDIIIAQDNINIKLTQLNYLVKMQSFSVPVLVGYGGPERVVISPGKPIVVPLGNIGEPNSPDFRFETPNPQIAEIVKLIEHEIIRIFRAYGIGSADFSLQGEVKSGFALVMENLKLLESRENELPFYEDAEEKLFEVIKCVWNYHAPFLPTDHRFHGIIIPENVHLQVSVNDISLPKTTSEEVAEWKFMFEHRLATPVDYLMRRYKLSEQEAEERLRRTTEWWENFDKETKNNLYE